MDPGGVATRVLEVTDQACREEIIAILLGIEETRGNEGNTARAGFPPSPPISALDAFSAPLIRYYGI